MSDNIFNRPRRQIEPRMSDERGRDFRDQSHTPDQGAAERRDPGAEALSELARLIGEPDPNAPVPGRADAVNKSGGRLADVSRNAISQAQDRPREGELYDDQSGDRSPEGRHRQYQQFEGRSSLDRGARREPDFGMTRPTAQPTHLDADHSETSHASDSFDFLRLPNRDDYAVAPRHALTDEEDHYHGDDRENSLTVRHSGYRRQDEEYPDQYHEGEYGQDEDREYGAEHDDSGDGESGVKRRSTAKVAIAILGLAVFGSAAAFGYRTIFKAAPSGPTPVIRADNSPTKVAPAGTEASARPGGGLFGDRSGEQLVRRDEEPVDVGSTYGSAAVDSGVAGSSPPEIVPATVGPAPPGSAPQGDAKRVRTVPIRAEQGPASDRTPPDRTPSRAAPAPQSQPAAPPPQRQAAAVPPPAYIPPAVEEGKVRGAAPVATAPDAPASRAIEPGGGGFVVQLSAQRSEAEAQTAFRTLQAKYAMLGGHELLIRRKDLGEKGIFFAAQVGPFGVKSDADQLCEALKGAGGACFVQKN